jgi:site-specific recombinase XerD
MKDTHDLPALLERFFTQRLMAQRRVSAHTIGSYRDTFRLLLLFAQRQLRKAPSTLSLTDLQAPLIGAFLDDLESRRGNTARSRNLRLTAIRSFFRFAAYEEPAHAALIQRVLAIPNKRFEKKLVGFLTRPEITALLDAPNLSGWAGRRDRALLMLAIQTGLRVSEITALRGCRAGHRCSRALPRQRPQRTLHPAHTTTGTHTRRMARRTCPSSNAPRLHQCARHKPEHRWRPVSLVQALDHSAPTLPIVAA